jgi:hypothetical protein
MFADKLAMLGIRASASPVVYGVASHALSLAFYSEAEIAIASDKPGVENPQPFFKPLPVDVHSNTSLRVVAVAPLL